MALMVFGCSNTPNETSEMNDSAPIVFDATDFAKIQIPIDDVVVTYIPEKMDTIVKKDTLKTDTTIKPAMRSLVVQHNKIDSILNVKKNK